MLTEVVAMNFSAPEVMVAAGAAVTVAETVSTVFAVMYVEK